MGTKCGWADLRTKLGDGCRSSVSSVVRGNLFLICVRCLMCPSFCGSAVNSQLPAPIRKSIADAALRVAACECAAAARRFSPEQSAEAAALANMLRAVFSSSTAAASTAEFRVQRRPCSLSRCSSIWMRGASVASRARAGNSTSTRPARRDPWVWWRWHSGGGRTRLGDGRRRRCRQA
jgi:hypothetical protein